MKIKQDELEIGDVFLAGNNSDLRVYKLLSITKSGSLKVSWYKEDDKNYPIYYYGNSIETDIEKFNRIAYLSNEQERFKKYFWLLSRCNGK